MTEPVPTLPSVAEVLEQSRDLFCVLSEQGAVVRANPAMLRGVGRSAKELIGERLGDLVEPGDRPAVGAAITAAVERSTNQRVSCVVALPDGGRRNVEWLMIPWGDDMLLGLGRDITERVSDRRQLEAVMRAIPDILAELDAGGRCVALHRADSAHLTPQVGEPIESGLPGELGRAIRGGFDAAQATGEVHHCMYQDRASDGREWEARITPLAAGGALVLIRDATETNAPGRALLANLRSLDDSAQKLSHGLREPLVGMRDLMSRLAESAPEPVRHEAGKLLGKMEQKLDNMDRLLHAVRRYVRVGARWPEPEPVELEALIDRAIAAVRRRRARMFEVSTHVESGAGPLCTVGRALESCLVEIVDNAVAHHDRERCHIDVRVVKRPGYWRVEIVDDGPGVDAGLGASMFDLFVRGEDAGGEHGGLGLAVVKRALALCHGDVEVRSPVYDRRGTAVVLQWPEAWPRAGAVR